MNAKSPSELWVDSKDIGDALIYHLNLAPATMKRIYESMSPSESDFCAAAVRLGCVTQEDLAEARVKVRSDFTAEHAGLVETALRKLSPERRIVVHRGESVQPGEQLILAHQPDNPRSERLRALRHELLLLNDHNSRGANIVSVLSSGTKEGRSQLAAELALSFAQLGRRTLLVDTDMRKPSQHVLFGATNEHGLSRSLSEREAPYFHPVLGPPSMDLLTAGPVPPNPLELLSDGRFESLLSGWRNNYEFLVLDTPPVSLFADGLAVAALAKRVLLVGRTKHSSYKGTRDILRRLETTQSKILGAVLNYF